MPRHKVSGSLRAFAKRLRKDQTAIEEVLWQQLRAGRLGGFKFRRQAPIEGYVADFACFTARLIVEVDGPVHDRPQQREHDLARDAALRRHGFRVLRFDGEAVLGDLAGVLTVIEEALRSQGLPSPLAGEGGPRACPRVGRGGGS